MKKKESKSPGRYVMSRVPNNVAGQTMVKYMRKYMNYHDYKVRVRGNGPRAGVEGATEQSIPLTKATTFRVYIDPKERMMPVKDHESALTAVRQQQLRERADWTAAEASHNEVFHRTLKERNDAYDAMSVLRARPTDAALETENAMLKGQLGERNIRISHLNEELAEAQSTIRLLREELQVRGAGADTEKFAAEIRKLVAVIEGKDRVISRDCSRILALNTFIHQLRSWINDGSITI